MILMIMVIVININMAEISAKRKKKRKDKKKHLEAPDSLPAITLSVETKSSSLEEELDWCIRQLELGLLRPKDKGTSQQKQEAQAIISKLRSSKTPLPRKRQLMRLTFGDYRSKMREEDETMARAAKAAIIKEACPTSKDKHGQFYRSCQIKTIDLPHKEDNDFKFNFQIEAM